MINYYINLPLEIAFIILILRLFHYNNRAVYNLLAETYSHRQYLHQISFFLFFFFFQGTLYGTILVSMEVKLAKRQILKRKSLYKLLVKDGILNQIK